MTGLWTAYYLARLQPGMKIVVVEKEVAGFGPSGRNGGWVSSGMAGSSRAFGIKPTSPAAVRAEKETHRTVDEIGEVVAREGIRCDFLKAGMLTVATTEPQVRRLRAELEKAEAMGFGVDIHELSAQDMADRVFIPGARLGVLNRHGARIDPARLTRGLADACERSGVRIYENTEATTVGPRAVVCSTGTVRATHVIRATEAYTIQLPHESRRFLPLYSLMIATEPLSERAWREIGWIDGLLIRDTRHLFFYAQRTSDGRIAMGGRGAPYEFGSPIAVESEHNAAVKARLIAALHKHFPASASARITHHWGGPLAVPRDWSMCVDYDATTGFGFAGGYSGHGVVASNIAGRTLAHLISKTPTYLSTMPWVGHKARRWEPEPLRYMASRAIIRVLEAADRREDATGKTARAELLARPFMPPH
jgi:glycine/D-amino acid oxidase-like deaminating enzyme